MGVLLSKLLGASILALVLLAPTSVVHAQSVQVLPDSGTADAGIASTPIAHVVANDTVNGVKATLGTSGNGTLAKVGTWAAGFTLTLATGAISTSTAVAAGNYNLQYKLCVKGHPATCSTTAAAVAVIVPSILPQPDSGTSVAGVGSIPIAHVNANDLINGAAATLGATGNSAVSVVGAWPAGVSLTAATGAVTTTAATPSGTYSLQYRLCDKNVPPVCVTATDSLTVSSVVIVATAESGTADAGLASTAIRNIAANDTVGGAAAKLGASGNSTVAKVGTWPSGISLVLVTGAVTTSAAVPVGTYSLQYKLCDKNQRPDCATATDTVAVKTPILAAVSESGNALAGIGSIPIANVAANDSVNGATALLGSAGNATVAVSGTWPSGITLNSATGAVAVATTTPPGSYPLVYKLCDINTPPSCTTASDTVSVVTPVVNAAQDTGIAQLGSVSIPIANVAANDSVDGAPATLGASGNARLSQFSTWPASATLDPASGAITVDGSAPEGILQLQYQLCDASDAQNCAVSTDVVLVSQGYPEVQVSPQVFGDIEFDWGRDGIYCASCNFGQGNARFNWTQQGGTVWVGHLDPTTGAFTPVTGDNELVDSSSVYVINGPEWAFSTQNGQVLSQLVYTRVTPGQPATVSNGGVGFATPADGGWSLSFLPGAGPASGGTMNTANPIASQCIGDPVALALFNDNSNPQDVFSEPLSTADGTTPLTTPFGAYFSDFSGGKPSQHWVPCTHDLVFIGRATDGSGDVTQQVFWFNSDTQVVAQLTSDPRGETEAFMFQAPEFGGNYVFYTITDNQEIDVFQQTGVDGSGTPTFQLASQITSPDPLEPAIGSTEPFINCTPVCHSYIFMKLSAVPINPGNRTTVANGLAVTSIDPGHPQFRILAPSWGTANMQRTDPEYFIGANGPMLYYGGVVMATSSAPVQILGYYYMDLKLGTPSGACVGSSAEGGMVPGC